MLLEIYNGRKIVILAAPELFDAYYLYLTHLIFSLLIFIHSLNILFTWVLGFTFTYFLFIY